MSRARVVLIALIAVIPTFGLLVGVGPVQAAPARPVITARPAITVFLADGVTPAGDTVLHPGDEVVVKGTGFDPRANTGGLPVPVPPGVPHGTFVTFGGFAPVWQPSKGAPAAARAETRSKTKWVLSRSALAKVPNAPFDLRRTVRQQWVPLAADGTFTARLSLATPATVPAGARWGVYTYGAADAVNAAQEKFVPLNYSTAAGPKTPQPAAKNLVWGYSPSFASTVTASGGSLSGKGGASVDESGRLAFELADSTVRDGRGQLRYRGTVVAFTKFHLLEIALADPIIRIDGTRAVLSLRTSSTDMNGDDALRRIDVADLYLTADQARRIAAGGDLTGVRAVFRPGVRPTSLAALSVGAASPVTLRF